MNPSIRIFKLLVWMSFADMFDRKLFNLLQTKWEKISGFTPEVKNLSSPIPSEFKVSI